MTESDGTELILLVQDRDDTWGFANKGNGMCV